MLNTWVSELAGISTLNVGATGNMNFNNATIEMLTLSGTAGALTLNGGAQLGFELKNDGTNDRITVAAGGTAVTGGTVTLNFFGSVAPGTYNLIIAPSGLGSATYALGTAPNGFNYTINVTDTLVSVTTAAFLPIYWTNSQTDGSWSTVNAGPLTNWSTDSMGLTNYTTVPTTTGTVVFSAANAPFSAGSQITTTLDAAFAIDSLQFLSAPSGITAVTLNPGTSGTLALSPVSTSGGIRVLAGGGIATLAAPLTVSAPQTWDVDPTGSLAINGNTVFNAAVNKTNTGALTLSGNNSGTGALTLSGGSLFINSATALGNGNFTIGAGTTIDNINGAVTALTNGNTQTWAGDFTFTGTNPLDLGGGAVTLGSTTAVTVGGANTLTVSGPIGGAFGLTKSGTGQMNLVSSASNTFTGPVVVNGGGAGTAHALILSKAGGTSIAGTSVTIGNNQAVANIDATLRLGASELINDAAILHFNNGLSNAKFELNNFNETLAGLVVDGGALPIIQNLETSLSGTSTLTINSSSADSAFGGIIRNNATGTGILALTKNGTSKLSLSGANITYTGGTSLLGGTFELNGASAFASAVTFGSGSTATLQVASAAQPVGGLFTADLLNTNEVVQNAPGVNAALTVNQATPTTFGGIFQDNAVSGSLKLIKSGAGNLTLANAGAYSGGTTVDNASLIFSVDQTLSGPLTFSAAAGNTTVSTLGLTNVNTTFNGALTVQTNSTLADTINVGSGKTLTLNGGITIGAASPGANWNSKLTIGGGGTLTVSAGTGGLVQVGGNNANAAGDSEASTLDLTGLQAVILNTSATGTLRVAQPNAANVTGNQAALLLPTPVAGITPTTPVTTITAANLNVGDGNGNGSGTNQTNALILGTGLTTLNATNLNVGTGGRDFGQITFAGGNGTIKIRAADGTSRAALNIGTGAASTGVGPGTGVTNNVDFTGHNADMLLSTVAVGTQTTRATAYTSSLTFDTGTLEMSSLAAGTRTSETTNGTGAARITNANITFAGGTVTIDSGILQFGDMAGSYVTGTQLPTINPTLSISGGTVTIGATAGTAITMAKVVSTGSSVAETVNAIINISGGATTIGGNIVKVGTSGTGTGTVTNTATINLTGGTFDMGGNSIGSSAQTIAFAPQAGTLQNLAQLNGGGVLTKSAAGALTLAGTNSYTGNTAITQGSLLVGSATAIPNGTGKGNVVLDGGAAAGIFDLNGTDTTINGLSGVTGAMLGQVVNNGSGTHTLSVGNANTTSAFAGSLLDNTGTGGVLALTKIGTGTLTLTGTSSYSGNTNVNAGTLNGTGTLSASKVLVNPGGTLKPGTTSTPGELTVYQTDFSAGGTLSIRIPSIAPGSYDLLTVTGPATYDAGRRSRFAGVEHRFDRAAIEHDRLGRHRASHDLEQRHQQPFPDGEHHQSQQCGPGPRAGQSQLRQRRRGRRNGRFEWTNSQPNRAGSGQHGHSRQSGRLRRAHGRRGRVDLLERHLRIPERRVQRVPARRRRRMEQSQPGADCRTHYQSRSEGVCALRLGRAGSL